LVTEKLPDAGVEPRLALAFSVVEETPRLGVGGALTVKRAPIVAGEPAAPAAVAVMVLVYAPAPRPLGFMVTAIDCAFPVETPLVGDRESQEAPVESE
jgi:hypothetical protein